MPACLGGGRCRGNFRELIHSMSNRKAINVTIPLPPSVLDWLDEEAKRQSVPRAQLVRGWVMREMEGQTLERLGRLNEAIQEIRMMLKKHSVAIEELAAAQLAIEP